MSVTLPAPPKEAQIKARLIDFGATMTPALGGPSQFIARLGARYAVDVQINPLDLCGARAWQAARKRAKTEALTLTLPWPQPAPTASLGTPVVNGASQAGARLAVRGLTAGVTLKAESYFSFVAGGRNYLHSLTADAVADGTGHATLWIAPMLRVQPADAAALEFTAPLVEGFLDGSAVEWTLDRLKFYGLGFTLTENA